jgi:hypothetical protein
MKLSFILAGLFVLFSLSVESASACSCAGEQIPCQAYSEASAVFLGTVIESRTVASKQGDFEMQSRLVRLSIDTPFRGVEGAEVEVMTGLGGGDCGFAFSQTRQYLVYANLYEGKLHTGICSRTRLASRAGEDLLYLRSLANAKPGAAISGKVVRYQRNEHGGSDSLPLRDVTITIDGAAKKELKTDIKGEFRQGGLVAGDYVVRAHAPEGLALRGQGEEKVQLMDRGCGVVYFSFENDGQISGRVLNPQGLPVNKAELFLYEPGKEQYQGYWESAYSTEDGTYAFKLVPPGRYILSIRFDGMTSQNRPFPEMYYPGVSDKADAKIITLAEGQHVTNDLEMPPLPLEFEIEGIVQYADGKPAPGARVGYGGGAPVVYSVPVDSRGRFSFKAYEGLKLHISATLETEKGKYIRSNGVSLLVAPGRPQVQLILPNP